MHRFIIAIPRKPTKWVLTSFLLIVAVTFLFAHYPDQSFRLSSRPWTTHTQNDEEKALEQLGFDGPVPSLCKPSVNSNSTYTCLGTRPAWLPSPAPIASSPSAGAPINGHASRETLPDHCIDAYFSKGEPCAAPGPKNMDVAWIWTNGSDPLFQYAIDKAEQAFIGTESTKNKVSLRKGAKLYRDHDELRYSLRSVLQHFGTYTTKFHVVTTDVGDAQGQRFGILPQWLDFDKGKNDGWTDGQVKLNVVHHSNIFRNLNNSTFNSFSIESQLAGLTTASEPFIYMNDDFFFTRDLTTSDFYSRVYGTVLRLDPGLGVPGTEWPTDNPSGEWQPLKYSNWLLNQRFGKRERPYMVHVAKTLSPTILREVASTWPEEFLETSSHRFRGQRDVYTTFLHGHYLIERWREILLWSWVVGKIGKDDDTWGEEERQRAWEELGGNEFTTIYVNMEIRKTLEKERRRLAHENADEPVPAATDYVFSNLDGYPFSLIGRKPVSFPKIAQGEDGYINQVPPNWAKEDWAHCQIVRNKCFPENESASQIFRRLLHTHPISCGDCVITALINQSGRLGLEAFLPPPHRIHYSNVKGRVVKPVDPASNPKLPLSKTPDGASFILKDVMRDWDTVRVRDWIQRAMERYRFVLGETPVRFGMLASPMAARRLLKAIDELPDLALLTVNDDVQVKAQEVDKVFREFLDRRWGFPSAWENVVYEP